jgi:hypothetical protein
MQVCIPGRIYGFENAGSSSRREKLEQSLFDRKLDCSKVESKRNTKSRETSAYLLQPQVLAALTRL